jgi:hypothetical protein
MEFSGMESMNITLFLMIDLNIFKGDNKPKNLGNCVLYSLATPFSSISINLNMALMSPILKSGSRKDAVVKALVHDHINE